MQAASQAVDASQVKHTSATTKSSDVMSHVSEASDVGSHASQVDSTFSAMAPWSPDTESKPSSNEVQAASQAVDASQINHTSSATKPSDVVSHVSQTFVEDSHTSQVNSTSSAMDSWSPDTES